LQGEVAVIPVMILFGLVAGRWWRTALVAGAVGWSVLLLATGVIGVADLPGAMLFGLANTAVGVGVHQGLLHLVRRNGPAPDSNRGASPAA
jgi:hypothetical protein